MGEEKKGAIGEEGKAGEQGGKGVVGWGEGGALRGEEGKGNGDGEREGVQPRDELFSYTGSGLSQTRQTLKLKSICKVTALPQRKENLKM